MNYILQKRTAIVTGLSENINLFDLFAQSASAYPDHAALKIGSDVLSYATLNAKALSIAASLHDVAEGEQHIGLFCHRSEAAYAGLLGILAAGKAYVPLNPKFPAERNAAILEALGIKTIIMDQGCATKFGELHHSYTHLKNILTPGWNMSAPANVRIHEPGAKTISAAALSADTEAYVLFTSGSTGKPKGVPIRHSNVRSYFRSLEQYVRLSADDRVSQMFDLTFDLSVHDIFLAFSSGACLCVVPERFVMAPSKFIQDEKITSWFCVPSVISSLMRLKLLKQDAFPDIKFSFFCGEPLNVQQVAAWREAASSSKLFNVYGPTETTIAITAYEIPAAPKNHNGVISLGRIFSSQSYLIDKENASDSNGELLLGGDQLSRGYLNDEERNRHAFPVINEKRYYRTGDIVFEDHDGDLFFIGRKDFQVKINGYRVELDEINNLIKEKFGYSLVLSALKPSEEIAGASLETLVTFIEADPSTEADKHTRIIEECKQFLPSYMVPKEIRFISSFPRNTNGKVDQKELLKLLTA